MDLVPVDHDPFANAPPPAVPNGVTLQPVDHDPWAPYVNPETGRPEISVSKAPAEGVVAKPGQTVAQPSMAQQVAGFPQRAADMAIGALGPIGEAGMTVGDMLRTGHVDPRDIPQVAGGVMLGVAAPEAEEAAPLEAGAVAAGKMAPDLFSQIKALGGDWHMAPVMDQAGNVIHNLISSENIGGPILRLNSDGSLSKGLIAYHGSPYDFDKFDLSKIGTGEGAQAYGHGLYFAENPATAGTYRNTQQLLNTPENIAAGYLQRYEDPSVAAKAIQDDLSNATDDANFQKHGPEALRLLQSGAEPKPGKMYQVSINADPEHFLDWDKPLSAQSDPVRQKLVSAGFTGAADDSEFAAGLKRMSQWMNTKDYNQSWRDSGDFRRDMGRMLDVWDSGGDQAGIEWLKSNPQSLVTYKALPNRSASFVDEVAKNPDNVDKLRQAGIPGIKYIDQGSRGQTRWIARHPLGGINDFSNEAEAQAFVRRNPEFSLEGPKQTKNYVVFDDKLIDIIKKYGDIIKKYGLAGLIAGGASHFATQPVDHDPFAARSQ